MEMKDQLKDQLLITRANVVVASSVPSGLYDILANDGRIVEICESGSNALAGLLSPICRTLDAKGGLVVPGLIDSHLHLDKALILERHPAITKTIAEALQVTTKLKNEFTVEDIRSRAQIVIEKEISFGTAVIRSHVEVDPFVGFNGLVALLDLREKYKWGITLQLSVFAQEGITNIPEQREMMIRAREMGGDLVGSAPYCDPNPGKNIKIVFDIAQQFNCDVDFHLDFIDDSSPMLLSKVAEETIERGWQGRVSLGHMTKLASLSPRELEENCILLAKAGISVLGLPASDMYMMARKDTHNVRRGIAPLERMCQLGVNVAIATNNLQNLFTPFGDGDILKICYLAAVALQLGTPESHKICLEMATVNAAKALSVGNYGIDKGNEASLVVFETVKSVSELIGAFPMQRVVVRRGQMISNLRLERRLHRPI
eukprot:Nk52_evm16s1810 gene=Nk52_evmTU16s1810